MEILFTGKGPPAKVMEILGGDEIFQAKKCSLFLPPPTPPPCHIQHPFSDPITSYQKLNEIS